MWIVVCLLPSSANLYARPGQLCSHTEDSQTSDNRQGHRLVQDNPSQLATCNTSNFLEYQPMCLWLSIARHTVQLEVNRPNLTQPVARY
ncbi:hypothetical protein BDP81DRAFT_424312 [Colletotrichum phormii]|uniref:Uncharacterized protein n=1 Tax=Colletotrichum phormii TaxID=359342 RepID=A0AAI9ZUL5_9PEZI|nr:uncharacterized protein BDP81DRAFT_424312 [Colletotrichum phormii]KAK1638145.1 hypothetical protein BDP81DRAFT_424312 [Colletotrichum phormii]